MSNTVVLGSLIAGGAALFYMVSTDKSKEEGGNQPPPLDVADDLGTAIEQGNTRAGVVSGVATAIKGATNPLSIPHTAASVAKHIIHNKIVVKAMDTSAKALDKAVTSPSTYKKILAGITNPFALVFGGKTDPVKPKKVRPPDPFVPKPTIDPFTNKWDKIIAAQRRLKKNLASWIDTEIKKRHSMSAAQFAKTAQLDYIQYKQQTNNDGKRTYGQLLKVDQAIDKKFKEDLSPVELAQYFGSMGTFNLQKMSIG